MEASELLTKTHAFAAELATNTYTRIASKQVREIADQLDTHLKKIKHDEYMED